MAKKDEKKAMTLAEVYEALPKVASPKAEFIARLAAVTYRSENAVRMWVSGARTPDILTQNVISQELGIPASELFPTTQQQ